MQKLFFIFLTVCFSLFLKGQTPGYMGKKTSIGYGFNINPAITAALLDYGTKIINTQHEFFIERAIKRKLSIGFSAKLYRSSYNNTGELVDPIAQSYGYGFSFGSGVSPGGSFDIKGRNYALYFKFFRKAYVAPWGRYFLLGITLNARKCTYDPAKMNLDYASYSYNGTYQTGSFSDFGTLVQNYIYPDILLGFGNSRIIANHLILDYGCTANVIAFTATVVDAFDQYTPTTEKYIQTNSGMRVRGINRFNAFIKVAYLF